MKKISTKDAENAVTNILDLNRQIRDLDAKRKDAEVVINHYSRDNIAQFRDDKLVCGTGMIQIKAGAAKPILNSGKVVSKALKEKLALLLPSRYVNQSIDVKSLYDCDDKVARQILQANDITIIKEDKFVVI